MEKNSYVVSLFGSFKLEIEGEDRFYYKTNINKEQILLDCRKSNNSMNFFKSSKEYVDWDNVYERSVVKQLDEDGTRWEGDWYNQKPFGFGSVYDGNGNRIYSGFMFEGKKIGFGTEYFADSHTVDYCGTFWDDKRHGRGTSYDRTTNKLYEGEWCCGRNDQSGRERIIIEDECEEDVVFIHAIIEELTIGVNCLNSWKSPFIVENCPCLQRITVKGRSCRNVDGVKIRNNEMLKVIDLENDVFTNAYEVILESIIEIVITIYIFLLYNLL